MLGPRRTQSTSSVCVSNRDDDMIHDLSDAVTTRGSTTPSLPLRQQPNSVIYRVILVGATGSGKTTYCNMLAPSKRASDTPLNRVRITRKLPSGALASVDLWDAKGADLLEGIGRDNEFWASYTKNMNGIIVIYNDKSLDEIDRVEQNWLKPLRELVAPRLPILLLLNKKFYSMEEHQNSMLAQLATRYHCNAASVSVVKSQELRESFSDFLCTIHYRDRLLSDLKLLTDSPPLPRDESIRKIDHEKSIIYYPVASSSTISSSHSAQVDQMQEEKYDDHETDRSCCWFCVHWC